VCRSFFTFDDFVDIRNAGLNSVRIPIGYWAVDVQDTEPYVSGQVSVRREHSNEELMSWRFRLV
jgi:aryl-phospho-beta-D-glucosidase BglC (GH1 family)